MSVPGKHTILFLAANPSGTAPLALEQEALDIEEQLRRSPYASRFEFKVRHAAKPVDLLHELRTLKPTVIHFSAHGRGPSEEGAGGSAVARDVHAGSERRAGLYLQGANGKALFVDEDKLKETFGDAGESVKLVVLNAC